MRRKLVLLSDFDGTVVNIDTGAYVLSKFANGDWEELERQFERGELTFEECLRNQFGMINHPKEEIVKMVEKATLVRDYFDDVVNCCKKKGVVFKIVSGGLDFCIEHILEREHLSVDVIVPKTTYGIHGLTLEFPKLSDVTSFSFKDDTVRKYQRLGFNVMYVGDGYADYSALREADVRFAIKDSASARLCKSNNVPYREIVDFEPVLTSLVESNQHSSRSLCSSEGGLRPNR